MSRNINVNPAHYKVAGRERQGEDIVQSAQKHAFGQQQAVEQRWQAQHGGGAPWETTPPAPLVDTPEERQRAEQKERRAAERARKSTPKKPASSKRGRKATPAAKTSRKAKTVKTIKKAANRAKTGKTAKKVSAKRRSSRR